MSKNCHKADVSSLCHQRYFRTPDMKWLCPDEWRDCASLWSLIRFSKLPNSMILVFIIGSLYSHTVQVIEAKSGWNQQRSKNCQRISAPFVCHQVYFVLQLRLGFLLNCFFVHEKVVVMIKVSWKKTKYVTCSSWAMRACAHKRDARIRSIYDNAWQG